MKNDKSVLIFGAGSTAALGMPATRRQDDFFKIFFFDENLDNLKTFGLEDSEIKRFKKLKNLKVENEFNVKDLIEFVRYFFKKDAFEMIDLYNLIDLQINKNQNLVIFKESEEIIYPNGRTLYPHDLVQYRKATLVLLQEYFSIQTKKALNNDSIKKYVGFFQRMGNLLLDKKGAKINQVKDLRESDFIFSDFSYISFNWDVLFLWTMFIAHKNLNDQNAHYYSREDEMFKLKVFNDFATFMACQSIENSTGKWYPYNESVAFRINDAEHYSDRKIVLIPTFFPHGQCNWLDCPYCGKLSVYLGDEFKLQSDTIVMQSPQAKAGKYHCVHCKKELSTKDSAMLLQTLFKVKTPYIEEIQRAMRIKVTEADRLIFIGYSLPADDIDYKSFFRTAKRDKEKTVYIVLHCENFKDEFYKAESILDGSLEKEVDENTRHRIQRYCDVFGKENVQVNLAGFPNAMESVLELFKG